MPDIGNDTTSSAQTADSSALASALGLMIDNSIEQARPNFGLGRGAKEREAVAEVVDEAVEDSDDETDNESDAEGNAPADDPDDADDDDSDDDDDEEETPKLSKRAAKKARREAEKEQLRVDLETERLAKEQAQSALAASETASADRRKEAIERMGDEAEFQRRHKALLANELSFEEREELMLWNNNREVAVLVREDLRQVMLSDLGREAAKVADLPGVDRNVVLKDPSFSKVCTHFHEAGVKVAQAAAAKAATVAADELSESQDQIEALKTEIKTLRAKAGAASTRAPEAKSGASGNPRLVETRLHRDASPEAMMQHHFQQTSRKRSA